MTEAYPRDMIGYGRTPPFADWPGGARVALQFVINYEEGGENNILHGDAASEAFLSEIVGAAPWPGQRHMNMESIYEYGSRAGFWRLHRMFVDRDMPVTVYAVATAMARNRPAVEAMNEAGWEIATHGYKWIDYRDTPKEIERQHIAEAIRIHTEVAGDATARLLSGPHVDQHDPAWAARRAASSIAPTPTPTTCPITSRGRAGRSSSCPIRSTPTTCVSRRRRGSTRATSSTPISRTPSTCSTPRARRRRKCCRSGCIAGWSAGRRRAAALARFLDYARCARQGLGRDSARHRAPLDRQARPARRLEAVAADAHFVRRAVRRDLRALALGGGGRLRSRARAASRHRRRACRGDGGGGRRGVGRAKARADRSPSRSRRPARARQTTDGRFNQGAGGRRARSPDA